LSACAGDTSARHDRTARDIILMRDSDYSLWTSGAGTGRHDGSHQFTATD
jgi:hypothetical protein